MNKISDLNAYKNISFTESLAFIYRNKGFGIQNNTITVNNKPLVLFLHKDPKTKLVSLCFKDKQVDQGTIEFDYQNRHSEAWSIVPLT